jgi:hypothetical protein
VRVRSAIFLNVFPSASGREKKKKNARPKSAQFPKQMIP